MNGTIPQVLQDQFKRLVKEVLDESEVWSTCLHCTKFTEATELCRAFAQPVRPPARVIVFGCSSFDEVQT